MLLNIFDLPSGWSNSHLWLLLLLLLLLCKMLL